MAAVLTLPMSAVASLQLAMSEILFGKFVNPVEGDVRTVSGISLRYHDA